MTNGALLLSARQTSRRPSLLSPHMNAVSAAVKNVYALFLLTALTDSETCKMAHLVADCVRNSRLLSIAIVQSASNEFADELNYLEQSFGAVINLSEQQTNLPAEDFSYQIVHGIHSIYDDEFYPYFMPIGFDDLMDFLSGRKTFVSFGEASGEKPATKAVKAMLNSPLLKTRLQGTRKGILNITGSYDSLMMLEVNEASAIVDAAAPPDADIWCICNLDENLGDKVVATMIFSVD